MPPTKPRAIQEDSRAERSSAKEKYSNTVALTGSRGRRHGNLNATTNGAPKDVISAGPSAPDQKVNTAGAQTINGGINWASEDACLLNAYRTAYSLPAPAACRCLINAAVLTAPGIGRHSPTMARRKEKRQTSQEQLAKTVRRHFNGLAVSETDVVVEFLCKVKTQDKAFRMRFAAPKDKH